MDILVYFGLPVLISFLIQLMIGCRTGRKVLQHIPLYAFIITLVFAGASLCTDSGFLIGGNIIAAAVWGIIGICILLGYGLAWMVQKFL